MRERHGLREQESMRTRKMERNEALGETGKLWRRGEMGNAERIRGQKMPRDQEE